MDKNTLKGAIEQRWRDRAKAQYLVPGSRTYLNMELEFFTGAMAAIHALDPEATDDKLSALVPTAWVIVPLSGRPIVPLPDDVKEPTVWVCVKCGSEDVMRDAYVDVNDEDDVHTYDSTTCSDCGYETSYGGVVTADEYDATEAR